MLQLSTTGLHGLWGWAALPGAHLAGSGQHSSSTAWSLSVAGGREPMFSSSTLATGGLPPKPTDRKTRLNVTPLSSYLKQWNLFQLFFWIPNLIPDPVGSLLWDVLKYVRRTVVMFFFSSLFWEGNDWTVRTCLRALCLDISVLRFPVLTIVSVSAGGATFRWDQPFGWEWRWKRHIALLWPHGQPGWKSRSTPISPKCSFGIMSLVTGRTLCV